MKMIPLVLVALLLSACQQPVRYAEDDPNYSIPAGSTLTLTRPITIPGGQVSVYVQNGQVVPARPRNPVNLYEPHCKVEMWSLGEAARSLEPQRFVVREVVRDWGPYARLPERRSGLVYVDGGNDGPLLLRYRTELIVGGKGPSDLYRLTCQHWVLAPELRHLTVAEIRQALGGLFILQLAGEATP